MGTIKEIWTKYKTWLITAIVGGSFSTLIYIGTLVFQDTKFYKKFDDTNRLKEKLINEVLPSMDSIANFRYKIVMLNSYRLDSLEAYIEAEKIAKKKTRAIGLRYDEETERIYFRGIDGELRRVLKDSDTGYYFYRDDDDKKRYVNL